MRSPIAEHSLKAERVKMNTSILLLMLPKTGLVGPA
jgi:hypothetical protein